MKLRRKRKTGIGAERQITAAQQSLSFSRRAVVLGAAQAGFGMILAGRLAYLSLAENEKYRGLSESNRVNLTLIPPRRGWFLDRTGRPLADNRSEFRVDIIPERVVDKQQTLATLQQLLSLPAEEMDRIEGELKIAQGFQPVQVAAGLSLEDYARVTVRQPDLPGVSPRQGYSRHYPSGAAVGHLLGYVGPASAADYERTKDPLLITPGFRIGKDGLEKMFEQRLRGKPGAKRVEVTARGKIVRELTTREDEPGLPVRLTIDGDLQYYAARRLGPESGSVVVIDCLTGDVLAMASMPSFDPNSFSSGIGVTEYKWLSQDDHVPLRNKVLSGLYPPGSTVKPMVAMSFLEGGLSPEETTVCNGGLRVGNRVFHCWKRSGHGVVNMSKGIYQSCDVYFYYFSQRIGMNQIASVARRLGLGQEYPLPVTTQSYGTVPDPEWKQRKYHQPWQTYDTVNATIGQGYMLVNPLQLAVMVSRLATGRRLNPHLVYGARHGDVPSLGFDEGHISIVRNAMKDVVNGPGTAGRARLPIDNVLLAGKTGTAQVVGLNIANGKAGAPWKYRDHGLFICFAPFDNPRYACAVVIEHGGGSGAAYPVARDVLTFLYDRDKAMAQLLPLEAQWGGTIEQRMARNLAIFRNQGRAPSNPDPAGEVHAPPPPETVRSRAPAEQSGPPPAPRSTPAPPAGPPPQ